MKFDKKAVQFENANLNAIEISIVDVISNRTSSNTWITCTIKAI